MNKSLSLALLAAGILLLVFGYNAWNSFSSELSRALTGSPSDRAMWMLVGGVACTVAGLAGLLREAK